MHRAAIYLDLPGPGGLLVVAIDDVGGVPGGLLVDGLTDLRRIGIQPGMRFIPTTGGWAIPSAGVGIETSRAITWSPALPAAAMLDRTAGLAQRASAGRQLAADAAPEGGLAPLLTGRLPQLSPSADGPLDPSPDVPDDVGLGEAWLVRAWTLIGQQRDALVAGDVLAALRPTVDLIGLGVGLTPSGDDYLVGLLAGLAAMHDLVGVGLGASIAALAPARTTTVGASAIAHAARGAFAERLHDLLIALAHGRLADLATSIERATAYGATSGSDTLVGLFEGIDMALARRTRGLSVAA